MKRNLVLLDLLLMALTGVLGWQFRQNWLAARLREQKLMAQQATAKPPVPLSAQPPVTPVVAGNYLDVAARVLFSKDRNPNVEVIPPPAPPPMPALPAAHGYMNFGEPAVILTAKPGGQQKTYRPGDVVGEFKLVSVNNDDIVFEWSGKEVRRKLADITARAAPPPAPEAAPAPAAAAAKAEASTLSAAAKAGPGVSMGGEQRACNAGDTTPAGTTQDGFRKVTQASPFGNKCWWEPVK